MKTIKLKKTIVAPCEVQHHEEVDLGQYFFNPRRNVRFLTSPIRVKDFPEEDRKVIKRIAKYLFNVVVQNRRSNSHFTKVSKRTTRQFTNLTRIFACCVVESIKNRTTFGIYKSIAAVDALFREKKIFFTFTNYDELEHALFSKKLIEIRSSAFKDFHDTGRENFIRTLVPTLNLIKLCFEYGMKFQGSGMVADHMKFHPSNYTQIHIKSEDGATRNYFVTENWYESAKEKKARNKEEYKLFNKNDIRIVGSDEDTREYGSRIAVLRSKRAHMEMARKTFQMPKNNTYHLKISENIMSEIAKRRKSGDFYFSIGWDEWFSDFNQKEREAVSILVNSGKVVPEGIIKNTGEVVMMEELGNLRLKLNTWVEEGSFEHIIIDQEDCYRGGREVFVDIQELINYAEARHNGKPYVMQLTANTTKKPLDWDVFPKYYSPTDPAQCGALNQDTFNITYGEMKELGLVNNPLDLLVIQRGLKNRTLRHVNVDPSKIDFELLEKFLWNIPNINHKPDHYIQTIVSLCSSYNKKTSLGARDYLGWLNDSRNFYRKMEKESQELGKSADHKPLEYVERPMNVKTLSECREFNIKDVQQMIYSLSNDDAFRVFNGDLSKGGRYYGYVVQCMNKRIREKLVFLDDKGNKNEMTEVDFKSLHPRMLYDIVHKQCPKDPYHLKKRGPLDTEFPREEVKLALNIMINSENLKNSVKAVRYHFVKKLKIYKGDEKLKDEYIYGLLNKIAENHEPIKKFFFSGAGIKLQNVDSVVATEVMKRFLASTAKKGGKHYSPNAVIFPIHDSFLVEKRHQKLLQWCMDSSYKDVMMTKNNPLLTVCF